LAIVKINEIKKGNQIMLEKLLDISKGKGVSTFLINFFSAPLNRRISAPLYKPPGHLIISLKEGKQSESIEKT
jgi:hypothetical protein